MTSKQHSEQYKLLVKDNSLKQLQSLDANSITEIPEESVGAYPDDQGSENNSINIIHSRNVMYNPKKKGSISNGAKSLNTDTMGKIHENTSTKQHTSSNAQSSKIKLPQIGVADSRLNIDTHDSGSVNQINSPLAARSYRRQGSNIYTPRKDASHLRTPKPKDIIRIGSVQDQYQPQSPIKRGPLAFTKSALKRRGTVLQRALNQIQDMTENIDSAAVSQQNSYLQGMPGNQALNTLDNRSTLIPISTILDQTKRSQTVQKQPVREAGKIHVGPGSVATISHKFQIERKIQEFKNEKSKSKKLESKKSSIQPLSLHNTPIKPSHHPLPQLSPLNHSLNERDLSFTMNDNDDTLQLTIPPPDSHNFTQDHLLIQSEELFRKFMKVHELKKEEAGDLTSRKLADQANELITKEDIQYAAAFEAFKKILIMKYPDGSIPQKEFKQFNLDVKRNYFKRQLQDQLFRVVFRDTEFMKAVDKSLKAKDQYESGLKQLMPLNKYVQDQKVAVVSQGMKELHEKIENGQQKPLNNVQITLERKSKPAFNTEKLSFQPEEYFHKKQVSVFKKGLVKGGGGAKYNQAKLELERQKRMIEHPTTLRKKSLTYRDEPTLDRKGRINDKMYQFYPGLYNVVQQRIAEHTYENQKVIQDRVHNIVKEVNQERAPQNSSKSQSPYLLANSFTFDVTEILKEVKASQNEKNLYETYNELTREELQKLLDRKSGKIHQQMTQWENRRPNSRAGQINQRIDALGETTDEIEEIIKNILKQRDYTEEVAKKRKMLSTPRRSSKLAVASRNSSQGSGHGSRKSASQLNIHEQVIEEKVEKKRARIAPEPNSKLIERIERIAGKFADEAVVVLDKTSPFKIRGDALNAECEEIEAQLEEMDVNQFLREMELSMLRDAQVIKELEAGIFDNESLNQTLSQLNVLDEFEQSKAEQPLNLDKISSQKRGKSNMSIGGKSNMNIVESRTETKHDLNQDTQFTKMTSVTGQQTGMKTSITNRSNTRSQFQSEKPAKKKKKEVVDEDAKFSAMKVTKQIKIRHKGLMTEIQREIELNNKFFDNITEAEHQANKERIKYLRNQHDRDIRVREANAIRDFKKSKQGLLQQLIGTGQKKQKAVDLSLGSEATMFVKDTKQNTAVLEKLVELAEDQKKRIQELGMPLEDIKDQFMKKEKEKKEKIKPKRQSSKTQLTSSLRKGKSTLEPYSPDGIKKLQLGKKVVQFEKNRQIEIQMVGDGLMSNMSDSKTLPEINDDLIDQFQHEYSAQKAKEKQILLDAPSPEALSPVKNTLRTKNQIKMVNDRLSTAVFDIDSEKSDAHTVMTEGQEVTYLPLARTKKNPNSRGGAIMIEPKAPTIRLDSTLQKMHSPKKYEKLVLHDLLADFGIIDVPKVGEGKPITSKRVQRPIIEECIRSVIRFRKIEQRIPNSDGEMFHLNQDLLTKLSQNRLIRFYIFERVSVNVEDAVHERIISDTIKVENFDLKQKLNLLETKLFEEAMIQNVDVMKIREEVNEEFKTWLKELNKFQKSPNQPSLTLKLNLQNSSLFDSRMRGSAKTTNEPSYTSDASEKSTDKLKNQNNKKKAPVRKFTSRVNLKEDTSPVKLSDQLELQKQQNNISKKAQKRNSAMAHGVPENLTKEIEIKFENQDKMNHQQVSELIQKFGVIDQDKFLDFDVNQYFQMILQKKSQREIEDEEKRKKNVYWSKKRKEQHKMPWEKEKEKKDAEKKERQRQGKFSIQTYE